MTGTPYDGLWWTCHICGDPRPDVRISVQLHDRLLRGVSYTESVRYCNDRAACRAAARTFRFLEAR